MALFVQAHGLGVTCLPSLAGGQRARLSLGRRRFLDRSRRDGLRGGARRPFRRQGTGEAGSFAQFTVMVVEMALQGVAAVAQQVPAVGHLLGLRRAPASAVGVGASPIADDDGVKAE